MTSATDLYFHNHFFNSEYGSLSCHEKTNHSLTYLDYRRCPEVLEGN